MKATVFFSAMADLTVQVEVPDGLDPEEARDAALDLAYESLPAGLCAHCSGWRQSWSRELGQWEAIDENPVELAVEPLPSPVPVGEPEGS